jgi:hypothetical protein
MEIHLGSWSCSFTEWRPANGRVFKDLIAYDVETTLIDTDHPYIVPTFVLGAACDGTRGVFLHWDSLLPFFQLHAGVAMICHNAPFDLKVTQGVLGNRHDIYAAVDKNEVWDTLILKRLLSLATAGHTARGEAGLEHCAHEHLKVDLDKHRTDAVGRGVRTNFGQFLGRPFAEIPEPYLRYAAADPLATWHLFWELNRRIKAVLQDASNVWGYVDDNWLRSVIQAFGPLSHHIQLRASIVMDEISRNGIGVDPPRHEEKVRKVSELRETCRYRMRQRGFLAGEKGSMKAMQSILSQLKRERPGLELKTTPSGEHWSTTEDSLAELAAEDQFFADYVAFKAADKLLSTYLGKMRRQRLHARFGYLLETGRTYCGGGLNLQNLPREGDIHDAASTIRGCFTPAEDHVFIDADYSQIELVVLAQAILSQFRRPSYLASLINNGHDVHRLIASKVLNKPVDAVTKQERDGVKAISFGRPGGMGAARLKTIARANYGLELSEDDVLRRIDAYHKLCPELNEFLADNLDVGMVLAQSLHLTPANYYTAIGNYFSSEDPSLRQPQGWLGGMLLKVLKNEEPVTGGGRRYTEGEKRFFWERAQELAVHLPQKLQMKLRQQSPDWKLFDSIRTWAGRRAVFTCTGRLRANATFCSSRNCIFQGLAADGAILGLWSIWRAGYSIVSFVHDQVIVEVRADDNVPAHVAAIESRLIQGMRAVTPELRVRVESVVTQSLNKKDLDPRYMSQLANLPNGSSPLVGTGATVAGAWG